MGVLLTSAQTQVQDQLQRKHEQLQHLIVQQQEELRLVSEQLLMTRYGILPPIVNVCYPTTSSASAIAAAPMIPVQQPQNPNTYQSHPQLQMHFQSQQLQEVSYMETSGHQQQPQRQGDVEQMVPQQQQGGGGASGNSEMISYGAVEQNVQLHPGMSNRLEMIPYQLTQQQAHVLFGSNMSPNQMHSNPGEGNG